MPSSERTVFQAEVAAVEEWFKVKPLSNADPDIRSDFHYRVLVLQGRRGRTPLHRSSQREELSQSNTLQTFKARSCSLFFHSTQSMGRRHIPMERKHQHSFSLFMALTSGQAGSRPGDTDGKILRDCVCLWVAVVVDRFQHQRTWTRFGR